MIAPRVGIFGGSGFYDFFDGAETLNVETPFGSPAGPVVVGELSGLPVAFMARHGLRHKFAAHRVPYRANVWAMRSIGVEAIIAPCSVGSLQRHISPGQFVVVDQLIDRTCGRAHTFFDVGGPADEPGWSGPLHHQSFADPYDAGLRSSLLDAARNVGADVVDGGTMVVINGPRFSTRAESAWYRAMGWDVVNMTGQPEAVLAAELGLRYATIALVTDYDAGVDGLTPVTMDEVLAMVRSNVSRVQSVIAAAVGLIPPSPAPTVPIPTFS